MNGDFFSFSWGILLHTGSCVWRWMRSPMATVFGDPYSLRNTVVLVVSLEVYRKFPWGNWTEFARGCLGSLVWGDFRFN